MSINGAATTAAAIAPAPNFPAPGGIFGIFPGILPPRVRLPFFPPSIFGISKPLLPPRSPRISPSLSAIAVANF